MHFLSQFLFFLKKIPGLLGNSFQNSKTTCLFSPTPEDYDWYEDLAQRW